MGKVKSGTMGPAFAKLTTILDYCEDRCVAYETGGHQPTPVVTSKLGSAMEFSAHAQPDIYENSFMDYVNRIVLGWGSDAATVRQAFKFKATHTDLIQLKNDNRLIDEVETKLPFPQCILVVNEPKADAHSLEHPEMQRSIHSAVMFLETRYIDELTESDWYEQHGMMMGDEFISITLGLLVDPTESLFFIPAEFHVIGGYSLDEIKWTAGVPHGCPQEMIAGLQGYGAFSVLTLAHWLGAINSPQVRRNLTTGLKPGRVHMARPKHRVFYEHTIMTIDPQKPVDIKDPMGHHAKHKLHPVRGFWRRFKSGKRTWVTPHWRGDKELGVVTHDYEVVATEDDDDV